MKRFILILIVILAVVGLVSFLTIVFSKVYFNTTFVIDPELASKFGDFFGGYVGTLLSALSVLLIVYSLITQNEENRKSEVRNHFFKMIDYHNENVKTLNISHIEADKNYKSEGRRAFVIYKIQIKRLLETLQEINEKLKLNLSNAEKIDIAYIIFYYGLDRKWGDFIKDKLSRHKQHSQIIDEFLKKIEGNPSVKIGRTNQTNLSAYFRNMYNAIKLVDTDKYLNSIEKKDLINIYRAQLSNPELYVLFFNLVSRFGKKWLENEFITRYTFLKNIPNGYCDGYNPKEFFDLKYEDEEY